MHFRQEVISQDTAFAPIVENQSTNFGGGQHSAMPLNSIHFPSTLTN
jgi:hypothetical protein